MKYNVRYSRTDNYLVTIEAESQDAAMEAAEVAIETANMKLVDKLEGEILFESIEETT